MPSYHLVLCHPLLLLPSIFPSIRVFSDELTLHISWPKYSHFSFSINPSSEYSGLISFRTDRFHLFAVQETLKIPWSPTPWFESINSSVISLLYGPTLTSIHDYWKNDSFDLMDLYWQNGWVCFLILCLGFSEFFFQKASLSLILWLQSLSTVILELKKVKSVTVSSSTPSMCHEVERLLLNHERHQDSWPPKEKTSIWGQRRGLIAQRFCVMKFIKVRKGIGRPSNIDIRRGWRVHPSLVLARELYTF